MMQILYLTRFF